MAGTVKAEFPQRCVPGLWLVLFSVTGSGGSVKDAYFFKIHPFLCEFIPAWYIGVEDIEKIDYSLEVL